MLDEMLIAGELQEPSKKVQLMRCICTSRQFVPHTDLCVRQI